MEPQNDPAETQQFSLLGFSYLHSRMSSGSLSHAIACHCLVIACFPISNLIGFFLMPFPLQSWALEIPLSYFHLRICAFCFLHVSSPRYFLLIFKISTLVVVSRKTFLIPLTWVSVVSGHISVFYSPCVIYNGLLTCLFLQ